MKTGAKTLDANKKKIGRIIHILKQVFHNAPKTELRYKTNWQFLIAVILSAQCTDKKVNDVTRKLFRKYKSLQSIARTRRAEFEKDIFSTGFYRSKAKNIIATAAMLLENFNGKVPCSMSELLTLPGVARKTANVVQGTLCDTPEGIAVDTHVARMSRLLHLTSGTNPRTIERDLMEIVPKKDWVEFSQLLVLYGRHICSSKKHNHTTCPLAIFYGDI